MKAVILSSMLVFSAFYIWVAFVNLPAGRAYLPIAEILAYSVFASTVWFLSFSLISNMAGSSSFFADLLALVTSLASTAFPFISFHAHVLGGVPLYVPAVISAIQFSATALLTAGFIFLAVHAAYRKIREGKAVFKVSAKSVETAMKHIYISSFYMSQLNLLVTAYMVYRFGSNVELNIVKRLTFELFGGNLTYVIVSEILTSAFIFLFFYYLPRNRYILDLTQMSDELAYTLSDAFGIFSLAIVTSDFLNNYFLIPLSRVILVTLPLGFLGFALIVNQRKSMVKLLGGRK